MLKKINETVSFLSGQITTKPQVGIILGTGLGGLVNDLKIEQTIDYKKIPHFPISTVEGHRGQLVFGSLGGKEIVAMQGRFHYYEGYTMQEITFPIRVMKKLGINLLILSNATGGINPDFNVGDLMIITDHINLMGDNPLMGVNFPELGARFPDMSEAYDKQLIAKAIAIAEKNKIEVKTGVLASVSGPCFETPAEYRYIRTIGADAVGMSIIPEVIAARHMGLTCFALSVISDLGVANKIVKVSHEEVQVAASKVEPKMTLIIKELLNSLS